MKRGFTLIEMMCVVMIMAVLVSFFIPQLTRSRSSARQAFCASNLRQIQLGWILYAKSNERYLPGEKGLSSDHSIKTSPLTGTVATGGHMSNEEVWRCPSDKRTSDYKYSYTLLAKMCMRIKASCCAVLGPSKITWFQPDVALVFGEENTETGLPWPFDYVINDPRFTNLDVFGPRHSQQSQGIFLDGHREMVEPADNPWTMSKYDPWIQ